MKHIQPRQSQKLLNILPRIMMLLILLQPLLDIISYWQTELAIPISLSFAPRAIIFAILFFGGLILSERKRVYYIMVAVIAVFWACHIAVCLQNGMTVSSMIHDTTYFISVLQLPITTVCMITCLKLTGEEGFDALFDGIFYSMAILMLSFVISVVTGTEPHTYPDREVGICGYCFWPNAQSAILSMSAPICIAYAVRKYKEKKLLCFAVIALSLTVLYLHATRLSYMCLIMTGVGMVLTMLIAKQPKRYLIAVGLVTAIFVGMITLSPMLANRSSVKKVTEKKADASERLIELGKLQIENGYSKVLIDAGVMEQKTGMQAFALSKPLTQSTFFDMEPLTEEALEEKIEALHKAKKSKAKTTNKQPQTEEELRLQNELVKQYGSYVAYVQTLELVTSSDKLYNFYPLENTRVVDLICSATRIYERYTGTEEYTGWQNAGNTWFDVFLNRSKVYGYDGKTIYQDNPWSICTRAQAAEILSRALPASEYSQVVDADSVPGMEQTAPYYDAVLMLYRAGIFFDLEDGESFRPDDEIDRLTYCLWAAAAVNPEFRRCDEGYSITLPEKLPQFDASALDPALKSDAELFPYYNYFINGVVDRFGIRTTAEEYERTTDIEEVADERAWKLHYCYILMDQSTPASRWFGLEADRLLHKGYSFDVENDIHAIFLRFGWVGMALMLAFLFYFAWVILKALIQNFKQVFTLEAGAIGIAILACLAHAYFTCGVLRRANSLYYFGVLLAGAYYLVKIKQYPPLEDDGSEKRRLFRRKKAKKADAGKETI